MGPHHYIIHILCDNMAVVQVVRSQKTKDKVLAACVRNIWLATADLDIELRISHIKGSENHIADLLTRLYSDAKVDQKLSHWVKNNCIWDAVPMQYFDLDLSI